MGIQENLTEVRNKIQQAALKSGRNYEDVTLVAVSKTVDIEAVRTAYSLGIRDFGENRVQELRKKQAALPEARWHMIGRLQTNKVKDVVGQAALIHSLDRWNLAEELDRRASLVGVTVPVLLQVNISGEEQKAGFDPGELDNFFASADQLQAVKILGFMTMAPLSYEAEKARPIFKELNHLYRLYSRKTYPNTQLQYLSMGMSQDFEVAIEEGANLVRIGTAIFGG